MAGAGVGAGLGAFDLAARGGGTGRDGPAVAFVDGGGATTWGLGNGSRDTGAGVGTGLVMVGLGASLGPETISVEGVCAGKGFSFMLLKASLASLFALTLQRTSVSSSGEERASHFTCQSICHPSSGLFASLDLLLVQQS